MIRRYLVSLLILVVVLCAVFSSFAFVTKAQVGAGAVVDENFHTDFVLPITISPGRYYRVEADVLQNFQQNTKFVASGPIDILSQNIQITTQEVSWKRDKTTITAPGASLQAQVQWRAKTNTDGQGTIELTFPEYKLEKPYVIDLHSGNFQIDNGHRWFRETQVYQNGASVFIGRMMFAGILAFPVGLLVHSIWWFFVLMREKRVRVAALAAGSSGALPRTFHPSPIAEFFWFTVVMSFFGFFGAFICILACTDSYLSLTMFGVVVITEGIGFLIALFVVWCVRRALVTMKLDADGIAFAKGRGELNWVTARWADLREVEVKERVYKGNRTEWVEITFPDGKRRYFSENTVDDYKLVRDTMFALFRHHHQPPEAPQPPAAG